MTELGLKLWQVKAMEAIDQLEEERQKGGVASDEADADLRCSNPSSRSSRNTWTRRTLQWDNTRLFAIQRQIA